MYKIADPGSTHHGNFKYAKDHVKMAANSGFNAIKFQLLEPEHVKNGNVQLPLEWIPDLIKIAKENNIDFFASVWTIEKMDFINSHGIKNCKLSYSAIHGNNGLELLKKSISTFDKTFTTHSMMDNIKRYTTNHFPMWTVEFNGIPIYPVPFNSNHPYYGDNKNIKGFSCHNINPAHDYKMCIINKAEVFEVHTRIGLYCDMDVPDGRFAISYKDWGAFA